MGEHTSLIVSAVLGFLWGGFSPVVFGITAFSLPWFLGLLILGIASAFIPNKA